MKIAPNLDYVDYIIVMKHENSTQFGLCRLFHGNDI